MATSAAPYGLRPVKRVDGMAYAGATSTYLIDPAGLANNIFNGSLVMRTASGYIALATGTGADITTNNLGGSSIGGLGVFVGCEYVDATGIVQHSQYYPSGTTGVVKCMVVDDPMVLFQAQMAGATGIEDTWQNCGLTAAQNATTSGSTTTGNSTMALNATTAATAKAFKIIAFSSAATDTYADVLVQINPGAHAFTTDVGI
tara:strand:+ start:1076 stop:1681 length:606 start_codon:yes stop_codon:yes gene_type:complete